MIPERRPSRILYISFTSPVPAKIGPSRRHYHILDQLSRFYNTHLLSLAKTSEAELFACEFGNRVPCYQFVPARSGRASKFTRKIWRTVTARCDFLPVLEPTLRRLCLRLGSRQSFDAIFLSSVLLRGLPLPQGIPVIGDTHNVEFDVLRRTSRVAGSLLYRQYARLQWASTRREEQRCAQRVDLLLATSDRDRKVFEHELALSNVNVIPNGIDVAEFAPTGVASEPKTILFPGLMSYYPNQQAVRWFLDAVFPLILRDTPGARFIIAGAAPPRWLTALRSATVEVTGMVPDMRPYIERASVVIAPLLIAGGTRVKILEAQAMAKPVVSTSVGAEGLELRQGESILIADDAKSFAEHVTLLLSDPELAAMIGNNARIHALAHFDWNHIGERLARLLQARIGLVPREVAAFNSLPVSQTIERQ